MSAKDDDPKPSGQLLRFPLERIKPALDAASVANRLAAKSQRVALPPEQEAILFLRIAGEIDAVLIKHLEAGQIDAKDLAGLLAHRLGALMRRIEERDTLLTVCEQVMRQQAASD